MSHRFLLLSLVFTSLVVVLFWFLLMKTAGDRNKAEAQVKQLTSDLEMVQPKISQLKADRLELVKALSSCNFLRKMEKLPLNQVELDLFKAVTTYYNSEAEVTKALEKYKVK